MHARRFELVVAGHTEADLEAALEEATERMRAGCFAGQDSRGEGGFYFDSRPLVDNAYLPSGMDMGEVAHG